MESTQHSVLHVAGVNTRGLFLSYGDRKFKWLKDLWSLNSWVGKPALLSLPGLPVGKATHSSELPFLHLLEESK